MRHADLAELLDEAWPMLERIVAEFPRHADDDLMQEAVLAFVESAQEHDLARCRRRIRAHLRRVVSERMRRAPAAARSELWSDPVATYDDLEFDARVRERLDRFEDSLRGLKRTVFRDRIAAAEPKAIERVADRCGVTPSLARRAERAVVEPLRRHLARELADSLPAVLGRV